MSNTKQLFSNARACFSENISRLPQRPMVGTLPKDDFLMWNLNRGLHDLTSALESVLDDLGSRVARLEKSQ